MSFDGLYASVRHGKTAHGKKVNSPGRQKFINQAYCGITSQRKEESTLAIRVKSLLEKYRDDAETRENILSQLGMYQVNLTIARECNDKKAIKERTREFNTFLNQF